MLQISLCLFLCSLNGYTVVLIINVQPNESLNYLTLPDDVNTLKS